LGQALIVRWFLAQTIYPLKWKWFQTLLWQVMKPVVIVFAWLFVVNWGKRISAKL
jgi:hypothetical protein